MPTAWASFTPPGPAPDEATLVLGPMLPSGGAILHRPRLGCGYLWSFGPPHCEGPLPALPPSPTPIGARLPLVLGPRTVGAGSGWRAGTALPRVRWKLLHRLYGARGEDRVFSLGAQGE